MRHLLIPLAALAMASGALPLQAQPFPDQRGNYGQGDGRDHRDDRHGDDRNGFDPGRGDGDRGRFEDRPDGRDWNRGRAYSHARPDPRYNGYYADNYYRGGNYQPRRLSANDRIYRGRDNRYYCRRSDGTTGLIVGALGGGTLGNVIAPGGSKTLGSIIGGSLGAVLGNSIDRNNVTCR